MKIQCTKDEWAALESLIIKEYTISTVYVERKFACQFFDESSGDFFIIEGEFIEEIG